MPHDQLNHRQRDRAESFGAVAAQYDRYRPGYPAALIDDLAALHPAAVLDVGCGTGKATRLLLERGLPVLGVEVDPQMAAVARTHGIDVEEATFERWDDRHRRFDLIIAAQAWHWVDPAVGAPKAARLLRPGGRLVLLWNFADLDDRTQALIDSVYRRLAPELVHESPQDDDDVHVRALAATGAFSSIETRIYPRETEWPLEEWIGNCGTHSDHLLLGRERLGDLQAALREALAAQGDTVRTTGGTYTIWARP